MNRFTLGGLACGLALLAAACSTGGGLSGNGPFGSGGPNSGTICAWTRPGGVVYDGFEAFSNTGGTATIDKVALVDARNLRLVTAWVVPITGTLVRVGQGYPSASSLASDAPGVRWELRQHIPDAVVRHTHGQEGINLVLVVKPSGKVGTAKAINLYYEVGETRYLRHFADGLRIQVGRTCH